MLGAQHAYAQQLNNAWIEGDRIWQKKKKNLKMNTFEGKLLRTSSFGKYGGCSWNMTDSHLTCYDGVKALVSLTKKYGSIFPECQWCQTWVNPSEAYEESERKCVCVCKTHLHTSPVYVLCLQSAVKAPPHREHHSYKSLKDRKRRMKLGTHEVHCTTTLAHHHEGRQDAQT